MRRSTAATFVACLLGTAVGLTRPSFPGAAEGAGNIVIQRHDPRFDDLFPRDPVVDVIASGQGLEWVEGPVWMPAGYLLFSDIPNNRVIEWRPGVGWRVFLESSGYTGRAPFEGREPGSNGLTLDPRGRIVLAEHGDRRIARLEEDGSKTTLVDRYQGRRLNSPNDLVYSTSGDLYFTDPPFGLPGGFEDQNRELDFQGVYRLSAAGELQLLTGALDAPNGIALSPDERTLYVTNADPARPTWWAFSMAADGTLGPGRLFYDGSAWTARWKGSADWLKVDERGNLFAAGPGGVHVFSPDGTLVGSLITGEATGNCAWGEDGSTLFVTASRSVYRVETRTRGVRPPGRGGRAAAAP